MTKLNVILSFAATVTMALTAIDTVNAANLRSEERVLTSIAIDSTKGERFLFEMEGSDSADDDGSLTTADNRFPQAVEESENAEDGSVDSTDNERFLVELNGAAAKFGERFNAERFLAEGKGSESGDSDDSTADTDGSSTVDGERFLMEMEGSESTEENGSLTTGGNLFPQEVEESENAEDDSSDSTEVDVE